MSPTEIAKIIPAAIIVQNEECFKYFCLEMDTRQYGRDPLFQAWGFFLSGWIAKRKHVADILGVPLND